jgi:sn-glycerol 3-phosphate transport system permease protein
MRRAHFKFSWIVPLLLAPQLLVIFTFFYWPSAQALYWAFTLEQPWGGGNTWVGLRELSRRCCRDPYYWGSVRVSVIYALATTVLAMGMALTLPLFVDRQLAGYKAYWRRIIWPYAVAAPAVGLAFRFVFNPGAASSAISTPIAPGWWDLSKYPWQAVTAIVIAGAWKQVAYSFIFFLAALQSIPRSLTEAAAMDGARP